MSECPALEIEDVSVHVEGRSVLNGFSLRVFPGEKVVLTGPSGAGKSTVLRCLMGLAVPGAGRIRIFGEPLDGRSVWALRRRIAYVAQEPDIGQGPVGDALRRPFEFRANAGCRKNLEKLPDLLVQFGLGEAILGRDATTLSGGEKQRIAWIGALLLDRPVLLLDEASSAMDEASRNAAADVLRTAEGTTVLSISHDAEWWKVCSRSILLHGLAWEGATS